MPFDSIAARCPRGGSRRDHEGKHGRDRDRDHEGKREGKQSGKHGRHRERPPPEPEPEEEEESESETPVGDREGPPPEPERADEDAIDQAIVSAMTQGPSDTQTAQALAELANQPGAAAPGGRAEAAREHAQRQVQEAGDLFNEAGRLVLQGQRQQGMQGGSIVQTTVQVTNVGLQDDASQTLLAAEIERLVQKVDDPSCLSIVYRATKAQMIAILTRQQANSQPAALSLGAASKAASPA